MTLLGLGAVAPLFLRGGSTDPSERGVAFGAGFVRGLGVSGSGKGGGASKGSSTIVTFFFRGARSFAPDGLPLFFSCAAGSTIASAILIYCNIFTTIDEQFKNVL